MTGASEILAFPKKTSTPPNPGTLVDLATTRAQMRLATVNKKRVNQHILEDQNDFWGNVH